MIIDNVSLAGGNGSVFRINVNGIPGPTVQNIEIAANDSAHVFVNTVVPDNASSLPFVVADSILLEWNGNRSWVQLDVWAQQAHYIRSGVISQNQDWPNDLPYVLLGPLTISAGATLSIAKGTHIYCHADAPVLIEGTLLAIGDSAEKDRIVFTGDRLDDPYNKYPASWPGIYFRPNSQFNQLQYVTVQNAYQGIVSEIPAAAEPGIQLNQCLIRNALDVGLLAYGSNITANNCIISNCGKNLRLVHGGEYRFNHCTIAAFNNTFFAHEEPVVWITDAYTDGENQSTASLSAAFTNCIIWGNGTAVENEFVAERKGGEDYLVQFNYGIWKMSTISSSYSTVGTLSNSDPLFVSMGNGEFPPDLHLKDGSPAIDFGLGGLNSIDFEGKSRLLNKPDAGAYEKQ